MAFLGGGSFVKLIQWTQMRLQTKLQNYFIYIILKCTVYPIKAFFKRVEINPITVVQKIHSFLGVKLLSLYKLTARFQPF